MNCKILIIVFVALWACEQCEALDGYPLDNDNEARLYMVTFLENNRSQAWIECTGTFIRSNYILTAASCVEGNMHTIDPRSGQINVFVIGSGNRHIIQEAIIHPKYDAKKPYENNIALLKVTTTPGTKPRSLDTITPNRICTMFGWEGYNTNQASAFPLRMYALPVGAAKNCDAEAPEAYCTLTGLNSSFEKCGGLMGAPVFCSGGGISGMIVNDKFCKGEDPPRGSIISIGDYKSFIEGILDPPTTTTTTASAESLISSKLPMLIFAVMSSWILI